MNTINTKTHLKEELRRKTNQLHIAFGFTHSIPIEREQQPKNDYGKIGKCIDCFEWFLITDKSKGHPLCSICQEHFELIN